jgi:hypothetical protein
VAVKTAKTGWLPGQMSESVVLWDMLVLAGLPYAARHILQPQVLEKALSQVVLLQRVDPGIHPWTTG